MLRFTFVGLTIAAALAAQSPLTTTFVSNNNGAIGGGLYFDLNVTAPLGITITGLDLNCNGTGSIEVYTVPGTRIGNQTNPAAWTLVSTGTVTGAVPNAVSPVAITPFALGLGSVGIALKAIGVAHHYTNGTGLNQNYSVGGLSLAAGEASNVAFVAPLFTPRVVNTNIHFTINGGLVPASNTTLGVGCVRSFASLYENFVAAASFDLSNNGMTLLPSGGAYVALPAVVSFVAPTPLATIVAIGDDVEQAVPLLSAFPFPGGSTTSLTVCSNGFVSVATGNGTAFTPVVASMLGFAQTAWGDWHDFLPSGGANGSVKFEEVGSLSIVTWDAVVDFGSATPNTWQLQFDRSSGAVHYVWGAMSLMGNGHLVFYSPGGPNLDPGNTDLSVVLPLGGVTLGATDTLPLALAGATTPVTGTNWNLNVTNVPATGVIGVDIFGFADPGINDLAFLGMPSCPLRSTLDLLSAWPVLGPSHGYGLAIPANPALVGIDLFTESAVFQVPPVNAFGAITSNGIKGSIGSF